MNDFLMFSHFSVPAGMITGLIGIFARSVVTSQAKVCVKRTLKRVVKRIVTRIVDLYNAPFSGTASVRPT